MPRDEDFAEIKQATFGATTLYSVLHAVLPTLDSVFTDKNKGFSLFRDIEFLYDKGLDFLPTGNGLLSILPKLVKAVASSTKSVLQFELPRIQDSKQNISMKY